MTIKSIRTKRTLLRKYKEEDRQKFINLFTDKDVNHFMGGPRSETIEDASALFDKGFEIYKGLFPDRHFEIWAIELEGEMIGHFELKQSVNTGEDELEAVYMLAKEQWGKGFMTEILIEINKYANRLNKTVIATFSPENSRTIRALEKAGIEKQEWYEHEDGRSLKAWLKKV